MKRWGFLHHLGRAALLALVSLLWAAGAARAADDFLDPEQAFRLSARALDAQRIEVRFDIAPGYYLYRERLKAEVEPAAVKLADTQIPKGKLKYDETFQKDVEYFRDAVTLVVVFQDAPTGVFKLSLGNQGCADKGLCYAPQKRGFKVEPGQGPGGTPRFTYLNEAQAEAWKPGDAIGLKAALNTSAPLSMASTAVLSSVANPAPPGDAGNAGDASSRALQSGSAIWVVGLFLLIGLGLSFTPCVLPMLPILSSIIVGQGSTPPSKARGFSLALAYSAGMVLVYTGFGVASALAGQGLGQALQNAWVLGAFALLLAVFSLSMFGFYELQMPAALQNALSQRSHALKGGEHLGVFLMGSLSSLIVGPCVAAPLAGALVYIGQTGDVALGATALFSMGVGMSVPLLLLGLSAGALLPRAGAWMVHVKHLFGVMLLAVAVWLAAPVLPGWAVMLLSAAVLVVAAICLGAFTSVPRSATPVRFLAKGAGLLLGLFAVAQVVGAATGGRDLARPLAHLRSGAPVQGAELPFQTVRSLAELEAAVRASGKPVMLDFYADWCVACKEFEKFTFTDGAVRQRLAGMTLLRADVTANNEDDKALLKRYTLFGPPALLFFAPAGDEIAGSRVIGYQDAREFSAHLDRMGASQVGMK
ncbi:protein-disulfide reductase DsbD [Sphaerotilaceae bacterium SBD11-9]